MAAGAEDRKEDPPAPAPVAATGGAAILARLRAQRAAGAAAAASRTASAASQQQQKVLFLYLSQTGTGQEIAKGLAAEAARRGIKAEAMSCNELGWQRFTPQTAPYAIFVAASTGDGDPPDNGAAFYVQLKKQHPPGHLSGVKFAVLGLGDSNYTRFMHVPRCVRSRLLDLGATELYPSAEADEVDGIESKVDPWCDGLWAPLRVAMAGGGGKDGGKDGGSEGGAKAAAAPVAPATPPPAATGAAAAAAGAQQPKQPPPPPAKLVNGLAPECVDLTGAPALAPPRVAASFDVPAAAAAAARAAADAPRPSAAQLEAAGGGGGDYSAANPYWARVAGARLLTDPSSDRKVVHVTLDVAGSGLRYTPGDSVGVLPENDPALVDALIARLKLDGGAVFDVVAAPASDGGAAAPAAAAGPSTLLPHLAPPCTVRAAFLRGLDVTGAPRKSLLRALAEHASDAAERPTLLFYTSRAGREAYASDMLTAQPTLLDLLERFKSCAPLLGVLLDALPPLAARMYSIACAPAEHYAGASASTAAAPAAAAEGQGKDGSGSGDNGADSQQPTALEFAFSVVTVSTPSGARPGVATGWLKRLLAPWLDGSKDSQQPQQDVRVPIFLRPSASFGPPADLAAPVVMIGPGTGVAPFRGFLQQRARAAAAAAATGVGPAWLYFGCRRRSEDYLYGDELEGWAADGTLARLRVAFSREAAAASGGDGGAGNTSAAAANGVAAAAEGAEAAAAAPAPPAKKTYVQHLMAEDAAELAALVLTPGAHVFVCGDGAGMARDVTAALADALRQHGGAELAAAGAAEAKLKAMAAAGTFVKDVWCA